MKLWIPDITDQLRLTADWEFPLFLERRNDSLVRKIDSTIPRIGYGQTQESIGCCLPIGTVLQVDRQYVRSGRQRAWNSITFRVKFHPEDKAKKRGEKFKGARFWAKLANVNEIECDPIEEQDRVK